jgi:hypothetical protein
VATWLEDDITGEWEWLGPPPAERRSFNAAMASEILKQVYTPAIRASLIRDSLLLARLENDFDRERMRGLDTERRLSYDFDSHAHHERLQIAMAEWRPRRRREDEGR